MDVALHQVPPDTLAIIRTAGGGGWGNPLERDPKKVYADVLEGFVSVEAAENEYGVIIHYDDRQKKFELDLHATQKKRSARLKS